MSPGHKITGAGLGLRRAHLGPLSLEVPTDIDFMEIAPENWIGAGGRLGDALTQLAERIPLAAHGLLLNLGGPDPIDIPYVRQVKEFLARYKVRAYGDHIAFCGESGLLYELLPMPFTAEAVHHLAARIRLVQEVLERRITIENASYYCVPLQELSEIDFINAVLAEADCELLLDVNNVYVNSVNHEYDAKEFIEKIPPQRIAYAHIAGHLRTETGLIIDTHGEAVIDPVWDLLTHAYKTLGRFPTLLERDENIPDLPTLLTEVRQIGSLQALHRPRRAPLPA